MSATTNDVFGVAAMSPDQSAAVRKHCFGDCGKIGIGAVIADDATGGLLVCCERTCPHEQEVTSGYGLTINREGRHVVHLRTLKAEGSAA